MGPTGVVWLLVIGALAGGVFAARAIGRARDARSRRRDVAAALAHGSDVVTLFDADCTPRYVSPSVRHVWGWEQREFLAAGAGLDAPGDAGRLLDALNEVQGRGPDSTSSVQGRLRHRDGSWRWVRFTVSNRLHDPDVAALVVTGHDITDRRLLEQKLEQGGLRDALTGIANRALFLDRVAHAVAARARTGGNDAVLALRLAAPDLTASLGQPGTEALLSAVADRLVACLRAGDTAARLDETSFAVLLVGVDDATGATRAAQRLREVLALPLPVRPPGGEEVDLAVSVNIGVALPDGLRPAEGLLADAESAAAEAAASGAPAVRVFDSTARQRAEERRVLREELRAVLVHGDLVMRYEPVVDLRDLTTVALDAQVSWHHPAHGPVHAPDLLVLAEECDLAATLGRWQLAQACAAAQEWGKQGAPAVTVQVSLPGAQVRDPALVDDIVAALAAADLPPSRLRVLLPERILMTDLPAAVDVLERLSAAGVRSGVQHFGTGYCSLSTLRGLPVDLLVLDSSLVAAIAQSSPHAAVARSVVMLARGAGIPLAAAGISDITQVVDLEGLGCRLGHGPYFTAPLGPAQVVDWLARERDRHGDIAE